MYKNNKREYKNILEMCVCVKEEGREEDSVERLLGQNLK